MHYTREAKIGIFVLAAVALFIYVGFQLGTFKIGSSNYALYELYFKDISGLLKKAEVKVAGVKVGWVDDIHLIAKDGFYARVDILIDPSCCLYEDAYGMVRKEGILGPTYVELVSGNPFKDRLKPGDKLMQENIGATSVDELMTSFKGIAQDIQEVSSSFKQMFAGVQVAQELSGLISDIKQVVDQLKIDLLPNVNQFAGHAAKTADVVQSVSPEFVESFKNINSISANIKESFSRFNDLFFVYDGHIENMLQRAEHTCFKDSKGIFEVRIYPRHDYFYLVGVTTSQKGYITRTTTLQEYTDSCLNEICPSVDLPEWARYQYIYNNNQKVVKRNAFKVDLQFGKWYKNVSLRAGLIEGTGGVAADLFVFRKGHYSFMSTFKIYDFWGQNRIDDNRPHLKWINRLFLFNHVYLALGVDDFASRCNKSFFVGAGFRFGEEDTKWFLPNYVGT